ncbi:MAG: DUF192 domain-containing protein [Patescibacteria group bacterium]
MLLRFVVNKGVYRWGVLIVLLGVVLFFLFSILDGKNTDRFYSSVRINNHTMEVEIADAPEARERGLGGHAPLSENEGMLFVFKNPEVQTFWMKRMIFPIDIVWMGIDADGKTFVAGIEKNVDPQIGAADSALALYQSPVPVRYVLEVRGGLTDLFGVRIGDPVLLYLAFGK